ncbi:MAG: AAA family ATPase [Kofleriaceae bacterium]
MRIDRLKVENYRALRSLELTELTPLTVLLGPNGSGKSTVFDVFSFLSECFTASLRSAWEKRGRFKELRTRGQTGPIVFELTYRETPDEQPTTYTLTVDEDAGGPFVASEILKWRRVERNQPGTPYQVLNFANGKGWVIPGERPLKDDKKVWETLDERDLLAVSTLGRLQSNPRVAALRRFITSWYVSYLSIDDTRGQPEPGAQERLSRTGDNLANVIQFLKERHPDRLVEIFARLSQRVPRLERVLSDPMPDGRLLLTIKDAPFDEPVLARFASDGTLKMLAYLMVLHDPTPPPFIGIEEPENFLHPRLLPGLAEECRSITERSQLLVTTHSPFFLDVLQPDQVRVLYRDERGYTNAVRVADIPGIPDFMAEGASLGHLWLENQFEVGDSLTRSGGPRRSRR